MKSLAESGEKMRKVEYVTVSAEQAGQRIDNFLLSRLKGVPRSRVYRVLRRGEVRVNKGRSKPTRRLLAGDIVRVPPLRQPERANTAPGVGLQRRLAAATLYEDDALLVIDKPAGIAVHGGSGVSHGVIEVLRALRPEQPCLELAHRLDRDTSGLLLLAKKRSALTRLQHLQLSGKVEKRYLALLAGRWRKGRVTVDAPLQKNTLHSGERVVRVAARGKPAVTHFTAQQRMPGATLVEARLETGRTHQIRVHAQHLGTPIAGDAKYGDEAANAHFRRNGLERLFLHAWRLQFPWEGRTEGYRFVAPLPAELQACLKKTQDSTANEDQDVPANR